jgi:hypothetical protein
MQGSTADSMKTCRTIKYQAFQIKRQFVRVRVRVVIALVGSSGILVAIAICFRAGCLVLVLSETVLVLERSLAGAIMRALGNVNSIPQSNSQNPSTSRSTIGFSHDNTPRSPLV